MKNTRPWISRKSLMASHKLGSNATALGLESVSEYCSRADQTENSLNYPPDSAFTILSTTIRYDAFFALLDNSAWQEPLAKLVSYSLFSYQLRFYSHYRFRVLFPTHIDKSGISTYRDMSLQFMSAMMGFAFMLDWTDEAAYLGYLACQSIRRNYQLAAEYNQGHRRGAIFMLRLFCSWRGDMSVDWPPYAYDVPEYEELLQTWRNPDPESIAPAVRLACDRHVAQSFNDTQKAWYDFGLVPRMPVEILMLFRLRQIAGLANPVIKHELFDAPFDRLPDKVAPYPGDNLLRCTLTRLHEDMPDYDKFVSLESLLQLT